MKNLKLLVFAAFIAGFVGFSLYSTDQVSGQAGGPLVAPTGLVASDNKYNNKIRIEWDAIRGATSYRVFRGSTSAPGSATDIGTTAANTFLDGPFGKTSTKGRSFNSSPTGERSILCVSIRRLNACLNWGIQFR